MNNKGFTLVELLGVIVIIGIVSSIAGVGVIALRNSLDAGLLESKIEIIESGAVNWGQDNMVVLSTSSSTCTVNGTRKSNCLTKTISSIGSSYIKGGDTCTNSSNSSYSCLKNDVTDKDMSSDTIYVYISNNRVYATYNTSSSSNS